MKYTQITFIFQFAGYAISAPQRLNMEHYIFANSSHAISLNKRSFFSKLDSTWVNSWIVGVTDGDGTFSISNQNGSWSLTFAIAQSCYNLRLLVFIKNYLKIGSISIDKNSNIAMFRVRDRKLLVHYILPIFDSYPLLTTKYYYYDRFKKILHILENNNLSKSEKDTLIFSLLNLDPDLSYISSALFDANIISKPWVIGFI
jgi:hypothetical protein